MPTLTQPTTATERRLAALDLVAERTADEDRLVIAPRHTFESEDGCRLFFADLNGDEPCRACLVGWATYAETIFGFADDSVQLAVENACDLLMISPDEDDNLSVTMATREGPATLAKVVMVAREVVLEGAAA